MIYAKTDYADFVGPAFGVLCVILGVLLKGVYDKYIQPELTAKERDRTYILESKRELLSHLNVVMQDKMTSLLAARQIMTMAEMTDEFAPGRKLLADLYVDRQTDAINAMKALRDLEGVYFPSYEADFRTYFKALRPLMDFGILRNTMLPDHTPSWSQADLPSEEAFNEENRLRSALVQRLRQEVIPDD